MTLRTNRKIVLRKRPEGLPKLSGLGIEEEATPDPAPQAAVIAGWLSSGELTLREHVEEGIENFPATLLKLFDGSHMGKLLLKVG